MLVCAAGTQRQRRGDRRSHGEAAPGIEEAQTAQWLPFPQVATTKYAEGGKKMYEKILVPLDGSKESECIIDHVRAIAKSCGVPEVVLLRVVEPFTPSSINYLGEATARNAEQKTKAAAEEYLSYVADGVRAHCGGVKTAVLEGDPASVILDYAAKNGVDLIAMSTRGAAGLAKWTVGSVTERVMRHSTIPLLSVMPTGQRH